MGVFKCPICCDKGLPAGEVPCWKCGSRRVRELAPAHSGDVERYYGASPDQATRRTRNGGCCDDKRLPPTAFQLPAVPGDGERPATAFLLSVGAHEEAEMLRHLREPGATTLLSNNTVDRVIALLREVATAHPRAVDPARAMNALLVAALHMRHTQACDTRGGHCSCGYSAATRLVHDEIADEIAALAALAGGNQ